MYLKYALSIYKPTNFWLKIRKEFCHLSIHQKACNKEEKSGDDETLTVIKCNNVVEKEQSNDENTDPIETTSIVNSSFIEITHENSSQTSNIPVFVSYPLYPNNNWHTINRGAVR